MDLKITVEVTDAEPSALKAVLSSALTVANMAEQYNAGEVDRHAEVRLDPKPAPAETPKPARKRKAKAEAKPAEAAPAPEAVQAPEETPAETPAAEVAPAPKPEAALAAAESGAALDLEDVRREFTRVAMDYPEGRKAINAILIEAEARALSDLTPDKFEWALGKIRDWEAAQK